MSNEPDTTTPMRSFINECEALLAHDRENVAVRILEPGRLESAFADIEVALPLQTGQMILFEEDTLLF